MFRVDAWLVAAALWLPVLGARAQASEARETVLDEQLNHEARLDLILQYALARSPVLAESSARSRAALERASASGRLPDPEFKYEQWAVPLTRPVDLKLANPLMFGLRQSFPAAGTRQARARMSAADAEIAGQQRRASERELVRRLRKAYFDFYAADQVLQLHEEHVGITEHMLAQLRGNYEVGRGKQQDLLKAIVELSRLHNTIAEGRQQRESSRFLLNTLMGRATDAPLGPPTVPSSSAAPQVRARELEPRTAERPEVAAAHTAARRSQAAAEGAHHTARRPAFMVGVDYWLTPTFSQPNSYGAMVTMSLPWLNPEHRAQARAAEQDLRADRYAADTVQRLASLELHQAVAGLDAARASIEILERDLMPQAERSLQATQSSFSIGQSDLLSLLDSLRSFFQVRLEHRRAYARVLSQLADVEFASGVNLFDQNPPEPQP
jgi:outer membrane protein, heavy metal efflux system